MMIGERYTLVLARIMEIKSESQVKEPYCSYFRKMASFFVEISRLIDDLAAGTIQTTDTLEQLQKRNERLYRDVRPGKYGQSYANPAYAAAELGEDFGPVLSFLYTELRTIIFYAHEQNLWEITIRMELFLQTYSSFADAFLENGREPKLEAVKENIYWFISDYSEPQAQMRVKEKLDPKENFAYRIIMESDLSDFRYLYRFGEYITPNQLETARYLASMPEETVRKMADTYTEGYRIGFVKNNKDLSKKQVVNIVYPIGFERMVKLAIANFEKMGLQSTVMRTPHSIFHKRGTQIAGYYSDSANKQFDFDHREDEGLFLDKKLIHRRLEVLVKAYETYRELAAVHAGPAWIEVFGEVPFVPEFKKTAVCLSEEQQKLSVQYQEQSVQIINRYIKGTERSYTIIAFPIPEIGSFYQEIMKETIALNTLDYQAYEHMQQLMIDALDEAEYVKVEGRNGNLTDLQIFLHPLKNPQKESKFENCVADVNIPVGEIFTSPVLKGTVGKLHVSTVYINQLEYRDLTITFADGMVTGYNCANFAAAEENRKYIKDNILYHHDTLPMGEFAVGTNTTAYQMGKKYNIGDRLSILIAEKTGPHFALGDTCYSHSEDLAVFNVDGKEIIARDNEISLLRKSDANQAYYGCHTDITIPYDELGSLYGVGADGKKIPIIEKGRFVLAGCEELNEPLEGL